MLRNEEKKETVELKWIDESTERTEWQSYITESTCNALASGKKIGLENTQYNRQLQMLKTYKSQLEISIKKKSQTAELASLKNLHTHLNLYITDIEEKYNSHLSLFYKFLFST